MKLHRIFCTLLIAAGMNASYIHAQTPRIYFTDITSGPNTGGENNDGAIVTIYGNRFGSTQGSSTVTFGSGAVAAYKTWSNTKVAVAIGPAATTGNIVVHTSSGDSNAVTFTVRAGNIYCVSTAGSDANSGQFPSSCWATLVHAKNTMAPGDITYAENGVTQTTLDKYNSTLSIQTAGTSASPIALIAYPGASVTIGNATILYAARTPNISGGPFSNWVIAGMFLEGIEGLDLSNVDGWRVIGNEATCPNGSSSLGGFGCIDTATTTNTAVLGNYVHDSGTNCGSGCKLFHAVYFSTNSNHIEFGWNTVIPDPNHTGIAGCRALQFHSTRGKDQFDLHVHDNLIHDAVCDGVNFDTVNPTNGPVEAYNNIIYHVGTGPAPSGTESNYACFNINGGSAKAPNVEIYNNTMYDCGSRLNADSGGLSVYIKARLRNNILDQINSEPYFTPNDGNCSLIGGSNNLWWGSGLPPACTNLTANVNADPLFVSPGSDFHLQSSSPAINAGITITTLLTDFDGITRPQGSAYDIGAYEFH